jgi:hypothetical protein
LVAGDKMIIGTHNGNIVRIDLSTLGLRSLINVAIACHTTTAVPVTTSLPRPLSLRDLHLHLSLSTPSLLEAETRPRRKGHGAPGCQSPPSRLWGVRFTCIRCRRVSKAERPQRSAKHTLEQYIHRHVFNGWKCLCAVAS